MKLLVIFLLGSLTVCAAAENIEVKILRTEGEMKAAQKKKKEKKLSKALNRKSLSVRDKLKKD